MASNKIHLDIGATDRASGTIKRVKASTIALGVVMGNLASKALTGLINMTRSWINEALLSEEANIKLAASLRGTGTYTVALEKKYQDLASAIQDETGASDESVKATIAQLTTMGMLENKMGDAARAVEAMRALGKSGSAAIVAIGRAFEGDYEALQRYIPALVLAKTEQEKIEILNKTFAAGYAQQTANLDTVSGSWKALQGRLGDMREAFVVAIWDGLKLGEAFNKMQISAGNFLKGEKWNDFLGSLEKGAKFAKDLGASLSSMTGFKAVGLAFGNVILAAIQEGADYFGSSISNSIKTAFDDSYVARLARYLGAKAKGRSDYNASPDSPQNQQIITQYESSKRFEKAVEAFQKTIRDTAKANRESASPAFVGPPRPDKGPPVVTPKTAEEIKQGLEDRRDEILEEVKERRATKELEKQIKDSTKKEADAAKELADAKKNLANLNKEGIAAWMNRANKEGQAAEDKEKADKDVKDDIRKAINKQRRMGRFGKVSKRDQELIDMNNKRNKEILDAAKKAKAAEKKGVDAGDEKKAWEKQLLQKNDNLLKEFVQIRTDLKSLLTQGGGKK